MKTITNHNKNEDNSDPKLGSTVAMSCYRSVNRNIRGDMFRRLFFVTFFLRKKKVKKDETRTKVELPNTAEKREKA